MAVIFGDKWVRTQNKEVSNHEEGRIHFGRPIDRSLEKMRKVSFRKGIASARPRRDAEDSAAEMQKRNDTI